MLFTKATYGDKGHKHDFEVTTLEIMGRKRSLESMNFGFEIKKIPGIEKFNV